VYLLSVFPCLMLVDLDVFYLGHLKNVYTIQYNTMFAAVDETFGHRSSLKCCSRDTLSI